MANNQEILLRSWIMDYNSNLKLVELEETLEEIVKSTGASMSVRETTYGDVPAIALDSIQNSQYMSLYHYMTREDGKDCIIVSVYGKGEQIRSTDLEKFYQKASGALSRFSYGFEKGKAISMRFGAGSMTSTIAAGIGAAGGMAIRGSVKLAAKGLRALTRDKEAYEKEMEFYSLAMGLGDFAIGCRGNEEIIEMLKFQSEKGNELAQYWLGMAYLEGRGIEPWRTRAFEWFDKAAADGEKRSRQLVVSEYLAGENDYQIEKKEMALKYLEEMADEGEKGAVEKLLGIYGGGTVKGILADYEKEFEYAKKYAELGNVDAAMTLAEALDTSLEAKSPSLSQYKDDAEAAVLYRSVLESDNKRFKGTVAARLAKMSKIGRGVTQDDTQFVHYCTIAANCGDLLAKVALVEAYTDGIGVERSQEKAKVFCSDLRKTGKTEYMPIVYYSNFVFADKDGNYSESMELAKKYLEHENGLPEKKEYMQKYLDEKNEQIANMPEEERMEFLKIEKPLFYGLRKKLHGLMKKA